MKGFPYDEGFSIHCWETTKAQRSQSFTKFFCALGRFEVFLLMDGASQGFGVDRFDEVQFD